MARSTSGHSIARARSEIDVIELSNPGTRPARTPPPERPRLNPRTWSQKQRRTALATAALALLALVTVRFWGGGDLADAYSTGIGEQRTIALPDGSTVELNARSSLRVHLTDRQRDVALLEGQALFRVAKDAQRPFVVRAGDAQVRAVGTEFDVYRKESETVVTVVEGRVETYDDSGHGGEGAIVLSAGERLTVVPHTVTKPTRADPAVATAWLQKRLIFEETPSERSGRGIQSVQPKTAQHRRPRTQDAQDQRRVFVNRSRIAHQFSAQPVIDPGHRNG